MSQYSDELQSACHGGDARQKRVTVLMQIANPLCSQRLLDSLPLHDCHVLVQVLSINTLPLDAGPLAGTLVSLRLELQVHLLGDHLG